MVIGVVLVSATPSIARIFSPTKCKAFSLVSALKNMAKSQYPKRLYEDSIFTPFIGSVGIFWNPLQKSPPFPEAVLSSNRYFCIDFSTMKHLK